MKTLSIAIILFVVGCSSTNEQWATVERDCQFTSAEREAAWGNVVSHVRSEHEDHAKFCELEESSEQQSFLVVQGECRVYLGCSKTVDGEFLTHGDMLVVVDEKTQEVVRAYGVKW
ncbi:hypothetical protein [Gilvimarinus sp. DA14]|uniref:hypothetical protein n=1 Tax=Gilvimarinus sp. DA14 TaxID=2956798 RepID=UPI0020B88938|nr:hypothetical protein [Gilvimarinus sp. DA14]UTF60124.1 hypothetical protein NHM04_16875 [Gilvimarinus sp. DA14]